MFHTKLVDCIIKLNKWIHKFHTVVLINSQSVKLYNTTSASSSSHWLLSSGITRIYDWGPDQLIPTVKNWNFLYTIHIIRTQVTCISTHTHHSCRNMLVSQWQWTTGLNQKFLSSFDSQVSGPQNMLRLCFIMQSNMHFTANVSEADNTTSLKVALADSINSSTCKALQLAVHCIHLALWPLILGALEKHLLTGTVSNNFNKCDPILIIFDVDNHQSPRSSYV